MPFRARVRKRGEQGRHHRGGERARRRDHEKDHGPVHRLAGGPPSHHDGRDAEQDGADHDDLRVAALEPLDEELSRRPIGLGLFHELDDSGQERLARRAGDGHVERPVPVDRSREDLRTCGLVDRCRLPGDRGLVHRGAALGDRPVGGDSRTGPNDDPVTHTQGRCGHGLLDAVAKANGFIGSEGHQGCDVTRRSRARVPLEGAAQREDQNEEGTVEPLTDCGRADRGDDHEQIDVERPTLARA